MPRLTFYTTACYKSGTLMAFSTHKTKEEADRMLAWHQDHPEWHLFDKIVQTAPNRTTRATWTR